MDEPVIVKQDAMEALYEHRAVSGLGKGIGLTADEFMLGVEHYDLSIIEALQTLISQAHADSKRWFPETSEGLFHMVLALCGEAGETANALKKGMRDGLYFDKAIERVKEETIDVFIYLLNIWAILKVDPAHELAVKRALNEERFGTKDVSNNG